MNVLLREVLVKAVKKIAIFGVSMYLAVAAFLYFFQEGLIFHPMPVEEDHQFRFRAQTEEIWVENTDGKLHGILFKTPMHTRGVVLYFKGNMGNVGYSEGIATIFLRLGFDVLSMDYRGSGKSIGPLSEEGLLHDAELWHAWATDHYGERVRVVGYSLGTTFASHLAGVKKVAETILFAPMHSVQEVGLRRYPFIPPFLVRYPLNSYEKLAAATGRIHIYHGTHDRVIPYESGESLKAVLNEDDHFTAVKGADHYTLVDRPEVLGHIISVWGQGAD